MFLKYMFLSSEKLILQSGLKFARVSRAKLLWHVQNWDLNICIICVCKIEIWLNWDPIIASDNVN